MDHQPSSGDFACVRTQSSKTNCARRVNPSVNYHLLAAHRLRPLAISLGLVFSGIGVAQADSTLGPGTVNTATSNTVFSGTLTVVGNTTINAVSYPLQVQTYSGSASVVVDASNGPITLNSERASGINAGFVNGGDAIVTVGKGNVTINTIADYGYGVIAGGSNSSGSGGSTVIDLAAGTSINTAGTGAGGVGATYLRSTVTADGSDIHTTGVYGYGAQASRGGSVSLTNTTIVTTGQRAYGLFNQFTSSPQVAGAASSMVTDATSVVTRGLTAYGSFNDGVGLTQLTDTSLTTYGNGAAGIAARNGAQVQVTGSTAGAAAVTTYGEVAPAILISNTQAGQTTVSAANASFQSTGADSPAMVITGVPGSSAVVSLSNAQLMSGAAAAVLVQNTQAQFAMVDSTVSAGAGQALLDVVSNSSPAAANLTAQSSTLNGAVLTDATGTSNLALSDKSVWNVTSPSVVTTLASNDSTLAFAPSAFQTSTPQVAASYSSVTVRNDYSASDGVVILNSYLNAGGPLNAQFTDRFLVMGNASGTTTINVEPVHGSPGAVTSPSGIINATEGISVVQVGGSSTEGAFKLQGGYVTAGSSPYQYTLHAYGPQSGHGSADASQSLVGNNGSYWDYRLQTAYVTPEGPVDEDLAEGGHPETEDEVKGNVEIPPEARLAVAPQVAAYLTAPAALMQAGIVDIDSLHRRLGEVRDDRDLDRDANGPGEVFVRAYGGHFDYSTNRSFSQYGYNATGDYSAVQFGGNVFKLRDNNDGIWRFGLAASLGWLHYAPEAADGPSSSRTNTFRLSGYSTYQSQRGWYVDGILSVGMFDGDISTDSRGDTFNLHGTGYAASMETGYPFALAGGFNLEPQLQLVGQHISFRNDVDADDLAVNIGSQNQLLGRLGARLTRPFDTNRGRVTPYASIDVLHSFTGGTNVQVGEGTFASGDYGSALQVSLGVNGTVTDKMSLYGRVSWQHSLGDAGFRSWLFNAGARIMF